MKQLKTSYTTLSLWSSGQYDEAVKAHFKIDRVTTPQMAEGKKYHEEWALFIQQCKELPRLFGGAKLKDPQTELFLDAQLADWLILRGVIDCLDGDTIYEWKTGTTSASAYAKGYQCGVYGLLALWNGKRAKMAQIHRYNQYEKRTDMAAKWLDAHYLRDTLGWVETHASKFKSYIEENNLEAKLGGAK